MTQMDTFKRGKRAGIRAAIKWLHDRADEMNDQHAKNILNSAAFNLGVDRVQGRLGDSATPMDGESDEYPEV